MSDILDTAREELAKGNGAESCPICYSIIRALVAEVERLRQRHAEAVEAAFAEAVCCTATSTDQIAAGLAKWDKSTAKARLT